MFTQFVRSQIKTGMFAAVCIGSCLAVLPVAGISLTSIQSGNWADPSSWDAAQVPQWDTTVTIADGHTITLGDALAHDIAGLVIENGGILTHAQNTTDALGERFKVILNISGALTINSGGTVNVDGKGFTNANGPGTPAGRQGSGSYGGMGYGVHFGKTYGSIIAPSNLGSGGGGWQGGEQYGGGAVILTVGGITTLNGSISSRGTATKDWGYYGSGGSIFLTTGSLTGNGMIDAGIITQNQSDGGAGGRIAVILTNSVNFGAIKMQAYSNSLKTKGASGTIYLEHTNHLAGEGRLIVDYNKYAPGNRNTCFTMQNGAEASAYAFSEIILTNGAVYGIDTDDSLDITDTIIYGDPTGNFDGLFLAGGTLTTKPDFTFSNHYFIAITDTATRLALDSLTVSANAIFRTDVPYTINCPVTIAAGGSFIDNGNTTAWPTATNLVINDNLILQTGGKMTASSLAVNGDLTLSANALLTHGQNSDQEIFRLCANVDGDLTIAAGGHISADSLGYAANYGPGYAVSAAGSHGGLADTATPASTYGSLKMPCRIGSGGKSWQTAAQNGGGAIMLTVTGTTTLDGIISANGNINTCQKWSGSGGSVSLVTGDLTGDGAITANGGPTEFGYPGAGGRIAVILTEGIIFDKRITLRALSGTTVKSYATTVGAAGTIYIETAGDANGNGTLLIDAANTTPAQAVTLISSNVIDTAVGTIIITNKAHLRIAAHQSLRVGGSWLNHGSFSAETNSSVTLVGAIPAVVQNNNQFWNLAITNSGKNVSFEAGKLNGVVGELRLGSVANDTPRLLLTSTVDGAPWLIALDETTGSQIIRRVAVRDSDATGGQMLTATKGSINKGNNQNWIFTSELGTRLIVR